MIVIFLDKEVLEEDIFFFDIFVIFEVLFIKEKILVYLKIELI